MPTKRVKFQVWSERKGHWRTAYVTGSTLFPNMVVMEKFGFRIRIGGDCR